ncbi:mechanosensitive ion channel family protein [Pseudorhodoferax sp. Leaf274]|uniref:mechanosensitive ion channel family protein n=1 Tax=Pseudorhodoferax sp. Leaf274 TaxID=1736318 RepID=UPI0007029FD3|nr:mechanosensitive ion channel domain-containing protein [Pseudorhodoferax sp. Leaf274]KQP47668.1 mechanosensitive ion channel protein MscS [Pseudorhodoferax sp. Leaf274]
MEALNGWSAWADHVLLRLAVAVVLAAVVSLFVHRAGALVLTRVTRGMPVAASVVRFVRVPARWWLLFVALQIVWQGAPDDLSWIDRVRHLNSLALLACLTWMGLRAVAGVAQGVIDQHPLNVVDNLNARRIHTQAKVLSRTVMVMVGVAGLALMLLTIPGARQFGASLLASAGVIGLVAGIAAKPVFGNLIAGLQIALAQPIRLDDVLIVQGEWGRVEEITGTYVVLAIWDQRRLIIPLQWFIENPFQNWTRRSAEIIGTVFLWMDYRMPLEPLRAEAQRICEASPHWDKRLCLLQVVDASERSMQLRWLVTAADSGKAFDLRCAVREGLIALIARDYPQYLPLTRAELRDEREPLAPMDAVGLPGSVLAQESPRPA